MYVTGKFRKSKASRRRLRSLVTLGAVAASSSIAGKAVVAAQEPTSAPAAQTDRITLHLPQRRFDIPSGPLSEVLGTFQKQAGVSVLVNLPDGTIEGFQSRGVSGEMDADRALDAVLADTGLQGRFVNATTVIVKVASSSETLNVVAPVAQLDLPLYTEPIRDIPQTVTVVSQSTMQDQGVVTLRDALRNVASISMAAGEGGSQGDNLTIRGFSARNDIFLDAARDFGSYYRDPFNYQQVEVLEGPSSVTFGRGSTGGVVNQVSKSPEASRILAGALNFGTDGLMRGTADVDERLPILGEGTAFRLNLMGTKTGVAGRDIAEYRRWGAAPSLAFGLGTPTQLVLSYFRESEYDTPDYGIPWLFNGPAPVERHNYYGFKDTNYLDTNVNVGTIRFDHVMSHGIALHDQLRYGYYTRNAQISEAQIAGAVNLSTPLDEITVNRNQISVSSVESMFDNQFDVTSSFVTGGLRHNLVTGAEVSRETSDPTRFKWAGVPMTSLLDPDESQIFTGTRTTSSIVHTTAVGVGLYAIDTVKLGQKFQLVGGLRWDYFNTDYNQGVAPLAAFSRVDSLPSYRAALVYTPTSNGSFYFDYGTSFNPSAESLSLSAATADLPPEHSRTYEVGTKWDLGNGQTTLRAALFSTEKTNAREPDPDNPLLNILSGVQQVNGFEIQVSGRMTKRWRLQSGYAYLNSVLVKSVGYPAAVGGRLANVPRNNFNLWTTYDLPWNFQIGAGGNYVGSRTASTTSPIDPVTGLVKELPGYWLFNAMAKYQITERMSVQVNLNNLADRYYYDEIHPAHIVPGEARVALFGFNCSF